LLWRAQLNRLCAHLGLAFASFAALHAFCQWNKTLFAQSVN
jgi:hypothetical protein